MGRLGPTHRRGDLRRYRTRLRRHLLPRSAHHAHLPRVPLICFQTAKLRRGVQDVRRDQVKCRQSPDYHDFTISSVFSATDQPSTRSALLTPNWRGCEGKIGGALLAQHRRQPVGLARFKQRSSPQQTVHGSHVASAPRVGLNGYRLPLSDRKFARLPAGGDWIRTCGSGVKGDAECNIRPLRRKSEEYRGLTKLYHGRELEVQIRLPPAKSQWRTPARNCDHSRDSDKTRTAIGARGANNCAVALFIGAIWYGRRIVDSKGRVASWSQPIKPQAGRI